MIKMSAAVIASIVLGSQTSWAYGWVLFLSLVCLVKDWE
jgi:hypothetical protein